MALSQKSQINHYLLDEFKIYKNMDLSDNSKDSIINYVLYSIEDFFKSEYGIYLNKEENVNKKFSVKKGMATLPSYNIEITIAKLDDNVIDVSDLYMVGNILKSKSGILTDGIDNLELTYNIGFSFDDIPFNLKLGLFIFADRLYEKVENNANLTSSFTDPVSGRVIIAQNIPKEIYQLISPYMVYNF